MMSMKKREILNDLLAAEDREKGKVIARYLKTSDLRFLGVQLPDITKIVNRHLKGLSEEDMIGLMRNLWNEPIFDCRRAAIDVMKKYASKGDITSALEMLDDWITTVDTWALLDPIGSNCLGTLLLRQRSLARTFQGWAKNDEIWRRRASILPYLFLSLKQNYRPEYAEEILKAVKPHISDEEFFVGKAAGWVIREFSKRDPERAAMFITAHRDSMTKLVLREASKKL